jgi:ATP-dependent RNA helicase DOB1
LEQDEASRDSIIIPDEERVAEYYEFRRQLEEMAEEYRDVISHPSYSLPFLQPGRLVKIEYEKLDFGWGAVINYQKCLPSKVMWFLHSSSF